MTEVIHDHDSSSNALMVVIVIIIIAIAGFFIWRYYTPAQPADTNQPGVNINVTLPTGSSSTQGSGSAY